MGENFSHIFIAHQLIADCDTIPGRYQNIEIADCIAAPAVATGYDDAPAVAKIADNGLGLSFGHRELETSPCRRLFECSRYLLLDRWERCVLFALSKRHSLTCIKGDLAEVD